MVYFQWPWVTLTIPNHPIFDILYRLSLIASGDIYFKLTVSVVNMWPLSLTSLSHWPSTSAYSTVGARHCDARVCQRQRRLVHTIVQQFEKISNLTRCSVSGDILQYKLEESVYHRRTRHVTQLFTYLLTHKLFSSCIRRYLMSRACNWVMSALSGVLLTVNFQFNLLFFNISLTRPHQNHIYGSGPHHHCSVLLDNIGQRTLPKIWRSLFLVRNVHPKGKTLKWFNGKNRN